MSRTENARKILENALTATPEDMLTDEELFNDPSFQAGMLRQAIKDAMHALTGHDCGNPECSSPHMIGCAMPALD